MQSTLAAVEKGHRFEPVRFSLSQEWVRDYVAAVEDGAIGGVGTYAPPMSLASLSIRALLEQSPLPPGSVHIGQELSFRRPAGVGENLTVHAEVSSRGERRGWVLMGVTLAVQSEDGSPVMDGRATITFPVDREAAG